MFLKIIIFFFLNYKYKMSFYGISYNPLNFSVNDPMFNLQTGVLLLQDQVNEGNTETTIDTSSSVEITAQQLLTGRIVRLGLTGTTLDTVVSATDIITALKAKIRSINDKDTIQNGTSFICQIYNPTDEWWGLLDNSANGVRVGGTLVPGHVHPGNTGIMEIIVNDQASLGGMHTDQVYICVSRCSTGVALD
jgi:hypothetical protein